MADRIVSGKAGRGLQLLVALLITLFFFYIDEGAYTLRGLSAAENWPATILLIGMLWGLQVFAAKVILRNYKGPYLILYSILGLLLFLGCLMGGGLLMYLV